MKASDEKRMTSLFGPPIPAEMDAAFEDAKSVEWPAGGKDSHAAMQVLINAILHTGIGGGAIGGWRLRQRDGRLVLSVCRVAITSKAA